MFFLAVIFQYVMDAYNRLTTTLNRFIIALAKQYLNKLRNQHYLTSHDLTAGELNITTLRLPRFCGGERENRG
jgi:hypothetical protein